METQSKLMIQLDKEQKVQHRISFNEELIEELYSTICKIDPKNLMLVEFLSLIIERDFIRNSNKLVDFANIFEEFKQQHLAMDQTGLISPVEGEE